MHNNNSHYEENACVLFWGQVQRKLFQHLFFCATRRFFLRLPATASIRCAVLEVTHRQHAFLEAVEKCIVIDHAGVFS
jgi:hypothetical protein